MRPRSFADFVGQPHLVGENAAFRKAAEADRLGSAILWGPPGVGKTTLASIVAGVTSADFRAVSAVNAGVADLRKVVELARQARRMGRRTILFIDEIHRFNKSQQDAILPVVEDGTVTLIGATTENPSFEVNSALLSRSRVYVMKSLEDEEVEALLMRAFTDSERGLGRSAEDIEPDALAAIADLANGDARSALNLLELVATIQPDRIGMADLEAAAQRRHLAYDKDGEQHFDLISALHKSIRGSDVDASLYWLARMLEGGEEPLYIARRLVRAASEDIGLADPHAITLAISVQQTVHFLGMPECAVALAQLTAFLAAAPKSNAVYKAYNRAVRDVEETRNDPVPMHLRNAPTKLMKELEYGKGYKYAHDFDGGVVFQQNLPDRLAGRVYYEPTDRGQERKIAERMAEVRRRWADTETDPTDSDS